MTRKTISVFNVYTYDCFCFYMLTCFFYVFPFLFRSKHTSSHSLHIPHRLSITSSHTHIRAYYIRWSTHYAHVLNILWMIWSMLCVYIVTYITYFTIIHRKPLIKLYNVIHIIRNVCVWYDGSCAGSVMGCDGHNMSIYTSTYEHKYKNNMNTTCKKRRNHACTHTHVTDTLHAFRYICHVCVCEGVRSAICQCSIWVNCCGITYANVQGKTWNHLAWYMFRTLIRLGTCMTDWKSKNHIQIKCCGRRKHIL